MTISSAIALHWASIAERRHRGDTWPEIARALSEGGIDVRHEHLRVYWNRAWGAKAPAAVIAELRAETAEMAVAELAAENVRLKEQALRDAAEIDRLRRQVADLMLPGNFDV